MARRFHQGGKLIAFGNGESSTDAQHIAVEFVHPVIVGKRALPAVSLTNDIATLTGLANHAGWDEGFAYQLEHLARPQDIAVGISRNGQCRNVLRGLEVARGRGLLTVALAGGAKSDVTTSVIADHALVVATEDPRLVKEVLVTLYHILWELVHVFLERQGGLESQVIR
jgi:D-sedoheptulose 7-phosphate isomerase